MAGFLLLIVAAFIIELTLVIPALMLFILQFPVVRSGLRRDYPEDWAKYTALILIYEAILAAVFFIMATTPRSYMDIGAVYNIFLILIFVIVLVIAMRYLIVRSYCYGTVLFSAGKWAGVHLKSDLFSKVNEADYAVRNPLNLKLKKGNRVKVSVRRGMANSVPTDIIEVVK